MDERHGAIAIPLDLKQPLRIVEWLFHQRSQHGMNFPRHACAARIWSFRQQLVQIFRDDFLRLRSAHAALRVFFFTLVFFLLVLDLLALAPEACFWVFRLPDFSITRFTDPCSHSAPLRTAALRLLCHSSESSSPAISFRLRFVSTE